ncbi:autophagy-related protein 2 homolog B isoform X3 [Scaptodrosophila lebanonensis]|uniref:Autophagy-related protein 2 n=1 Tax=Drosophila lebanonensis TaxID=7225 RepID=A0A6J2UH45_DROLE|nr:autophagy-related protein 2 homolog B isoform X3 [Scaptodrosophila lebanonensis]
MSWFNLWDGLKTKTCRYLLQRYLGQFFENNLNLEQLKVDLYNGKAVVENVSLKLNAFNDLCEEQGWAFEVVSGHIGCLTAIVPWNALMTNDSSLEIFNLTITLRPFIRKQNGTTMLESMWSSVSSSMQMAEECMNQVDDDVPFLIHNNAIIGLEKFAETIDNVLNRIHANLKDTTVNIEYILPNSGRKLLISFQANHVEYKNMTGNEKTPPTINEKSESNSDDRENNCNISPLPTITKHNLILRGLTILTSETFLVENNEDRKECNHKTKSITKLSKIVELKGYQNIQINIKQDENIIGPKVNLEVILDEIVVMLTPRQIHLLIEIINGFNNEYPTENIVIKDRESDTAQEYSESTKMSGVITPSKEWGKDKTISGIRSFPIADNIKALSSNKRRLTDSIISSESAHSTTTSFANANQEKNNLEKSGEILKFKMQIACVMGIILHKDILFSNCQNEYGYQLINVESYQNLSRIENNFFMFVNKDNPVQELELPEGNSSYLFFKVSPILLNGNQQRQYHELSSIISVSATMVDVSEILDNNADSLILFSRTKNCVDGYHKHPEVMVTFSSLFSGEQNCNRNYSKVECILDDCLVDLDISIYDRLSAHFAPSPFLKEYNSKYLKLDNSKSTIEVYIQSPFLKLHLRFPMVDGRLPEDPNKIAWWKKNIRRDYLVFNFQNIAITWKSHLRIVADEIQIFYAHGNLGNDVTHIINCVSYNVEGCATNQKNEKGICIDVEQAKQISHSLPDDVNDKNHSPFSSKCTYGFTSPVEGLQYETGQNSFLPGETEELDDFCHKTMTRSDLQISVFVPLVKVVLESKQLYEIMYNRINGDLFMWEPRSPLFKTHEVRSHTEYNSSDDCEPKKVCHSPNGSLLNKSIYFSLDSNKSLMEKLVKKSKNNCALKLVIDEMKLIMCTQVRDIETHVHPSQSGKFQFELKELQLFIVMGFNGDKNLNYICIQLNEMNILHCGLVPTSSSTAWSDEVDENIYQIIHNIPKLHQISNKRKETIAVAAEIKKYPKQNLKRMKVSFGINGVILRHTATLPGHSWLTQLIDFLDIADFPIDAYQPFALVTEIQVHLWNSAIDYRPKHFMYRAVIDIGSGNLSSNIVSSISGCTLGLIAEDCVLKIDQFGIKQINVSEDPLRIVENHFCLPHEKVDLLRAPVNFPDAEYSYTLCEMTITWHLFGGKDFPDKPESQENSRPSAVMSETYKYGVSQGHEGSAKNYEPNISHGFESFGRNTKVLVEIQLTKIRFSHEIYPQTSIYSSRQVLLVSDIEIRDRLQSSDINKLLYRGNNKNITGKNEDSMVIIKALHVRPDPQISRIEECSLRVSITPIKLNIDQDTLLFIEEFFAALLEISAVNSCPNDSKLQSNILGHDTPVMSVNQVSETTDEMEIKNMEEKLETLLNDTMSARAETDGNTNKLPIYFREVIFSPAVPICLDYHGRRIELSRGPITGLLMGLAQLQGSGICLREIINRRGLLGWDRLLTFLCKEWLKDIKRNQLPTILSGIGPTNAVLQLFHGLYDLFWLPIEQYNKDGRIIRGFQLGAQSFGARTAIAALEITSRIINILQFTAETTFDILSAGPSVRNKRQMKQGKKRRNRPKDIREGVANAYTLVKEGINDSANTLIEAAITEHDQNGYTGAVGAIVRQIPQLVVCPAVLATQATTNILGGAKSSLVPDANVEAREKWKHENK